MKSLSNGRGLLAHSGSYIIVIGMLAGLNLMTGEGLWFVFPALVWGAALGIHILYKLPFNRLAPRQHNFLRHAGVYLIIVTALAGINLLMPGSELWFLYPAFIWGAILALHFLFGVLLAGTQAAPEQNRNGAGQHAVKRLTRLSLYNKNLQLQFHRILSYRTQLNHLAATASGEYSRARLQNLAAQIDRWIGEIAELALRMDRFQRNGLLRKDLVALPKSIQNLERRLARETDETNRVEMKQTLHNLRQQLACVEQSDRIIKRAELQIERMLSSVVTVYSHILTGQSTPRTADYSRLSAEVDEQVRVLQDHLEALEEVKLGRM
jgi:hypothetical protein